MDLSYDLGWFCWGAQIKACLHAKKLAKTANFVKLVYDS